MQIRITWAELKNPSHPATAQSNPVGIPEEGLRPQKFSKLPRRFQRAALVEDPQVGLSFLSAKTELNCLLPREACSGSLSSLTLCANLLVSVLAGSAGPPAPPGPSFTAGSPGIEWRAWHKVGVSTNVYSVSLLSPYCVPATKGDTLPTVSQCF